MLKEHSSFVKQSIALLDLFLLTVSFYIAHGLASQARDLGPLLSYWPILIGFTAFYLYFAWTRQLFSVIQFSWMRGLLGRVSMIFVSAGILGAAILYVVPDAYNSRTVYLSFVGLSYLFIATEKQLLKELIARARRRNRNTTPVMLFGRGRTASYVLKRIADHPEWGMRVTRKLDLELSPEQFEEALKDAYVEEIFFCIPRTVTGTAFRIDPYLRICEEMGRPARVFLNIPNATHFARWDFHRFLDFPTLISHTVELDPDQMIFKRMFDVLGGVVGLGILFLVYPFLALSIKITAPGPVFFRQVRVGRNGKRFIIYKFRSMYLDAEERKKELMALNELKGAVFKLKDDPRIFPVGKIIRTLSLDELPQFINVLKGEMSLVGTRPPTPDEVATYEKWHHRRISIKPGITGMWQVSGRNKITDFDEIVRLDLKYIDTWSLWQDVVIIFKTVMVMFKRDGAY